MTGDAKIWGPQGSEKGHGAMSDLIRRLRDRADGRGQLKAWEGCDCCDDAELTADEIERLETELATARAIVGFSECPCKVADEPCNINCPCGNHYMSGVCYCCVPLSRHEHARKKHAEYIIKEAREAAEAAKGSQ